MSISRIFSTYKDEIELSLIQNSIVECELYSIVANVLRDCEQGSAISLRDVTARRTTDKSIQLKGDGGFPDFVILERTKSGTAKKLGCIEIKRPFAKFDPEQLKGHINSFPRVLITNGLLWRLYKPYKPEKEIEIEWEISLGEIDERGQIKWEDNKKWYELLQNLDETKWTVDEKMDNI